MDTTCDLTAIDHHIPLPMQGSTLHISNNMRHILMCCLGNRQVP